MKPPDPRPTIRVEPDGSVTLAGRGEEAPRHVTTGEALAGQILAGLIPRGRPLRLAVAAAMAIAVADGRSRFAVDVAHAQLRALLDGGDGEDGGALRRALPVWTRMRELLDLTPPADAAARLRLEVRLIEVELWEEEWALTRHLLALLRQSAALLPGHRLTVLLDAGAAAPGLGDPGPAFQAAALAMDDGIDVDMLPLGGASDPAAAGLVLVDAVAAGVDGSVLAAADAAGPARMAARADIPVWTLLSAACIDWLAPVAGETLLPSGLLAGHVTERGRCPASTAGLTALYPEQDRTAPAANEA